MKTKFKSINRYSAALQYGDELRLITKVDELPEVHSHYRLLPQDVWDGVVVVTTLTQLLELIENINVSRLVDVDGQIATLEYIVVPIVLTVSAVDNTADLTKLDVANKRKSALAKLTDEDKLILGINE